MARKKSSPQARTTSTRSTDDDVMVVENTPTINRPMLNPMIQKIMTYLGLATMAIWFVIGLYFLPILFTSVQSGQYLASLGISKPTEEPTDMEPSTTEATLPGIGKVNITCAQEALPVEALQKIVADKNLNSLNEEQKQKFEPCITEKETASPSPAAQ